MDPIADAGNLSVVVFKLALQAEPSYKSGEFQSWASRG